MPIIDPSSHHRRSWSVRKGPSMPGKRFGHCAVLLPDNKYVLVTGGHNGENYARNGILWSIERETWLQGSNSIHIPKKIVSKI